MFLDKSAYLYRSKVMHARKFPVKYHFTYRIFSFFVDIDRLDELQNKQRWFSHNRFNLFSLYDKNHGARTDQDWRSWINELLDQKGLPAAKNKVYLLCLPRILGYTFNPLSLWFCYNDFDQLTAVIGEVSNTFGEKHNYIMHNNNQPLPPIVEDQHDKIFYVSPFIDMQKRYHFSIFHPDKQLSVLIKEYEDDKLMLTASQYGKCQSFSSRNLWQCFFSMPFMTAKVVAMIHWHALKIWLRGGKYYPHQPKQEIKPARK